MFFFFIEHSNVTNILIFLDCWETSGKSHDCERAQCVSDKKPPPAKNTTKFCCCAGNLCNMNFTDAYVPVEESTSSPTTETLNKTTLSPLIWIMSIALFLALMVCSGIIIYFWWRMKPKKDDIEMGQHSMPPPPDYSLDKLKLINIIGIIFFFMHYII